MSDGENGEEGEVGGGDEVMAGRGREGRIQWL